MIRPIAFVDTAKVAAQFTLKFSKDLRDGVLPLRSADGPEAVLKEWLTAKALLARIRQAMTLDGVEPEPGKAWIERLPGCCGTPWTLEDDVYAQGHVRTRTCLTPVPDCFSFSGADKVTLGVGWINIIDHRLLCSEVNFSPWPRVHLVADFRVPVPVRQA